MTDATDDLDDWREDLELEQAMRKQTILQDDEQIVWVWSYELKHLGCWPGEDYKGHNQPVEVITKQHHAQTLAKVLDQVIQYAEAIGRSGDIIRYCEHLKEQVKS